MDLTTFDCILPILSRQASINGWIGLTVAILFMGISSLGYYIVRVFFKSEHKTEDRWLAFIGTILIVAGIVGFLLFLWIGLPRVVNPMYYALDYYVDIVKFSKGLYKP